LPARPAKRRGTRNRTREYKDKNTRLKTGKGKRSGRQLQVEPKREGIGGGKAAAAALVVTSGDCSGMQPAFEIRVSPLHVDKKDTDFNSGWNPLSNSLPRSNIEV
jgi:hypothetical protein